MLHPQRTGKGAVRCEQCLSITSSAGILKHTLCSHCERERESESERERERERERVRVCLLYVGSHLTLASAH